MNFIITIAYFLLFTFLIKKWKFFNSKYLTKNFLILVLFIKFFFGLAGYWTYTKYYPDRFKADIFKYYDDSKVIHDALKEKPIDFFKIIFSIGNDNEYFFSNYYINMNHWDTPYDTNLFNDSHTIIRANAIIRIFSFSNYFVHILFFCMLSIIGTFALFKATRHYFPNKELFLKLCLFFTPSLLFWSSGVIKEPIVMFALGIILLSIYNLLYKNIYIKDLFLLGASTLLLFYIKFYVLFSFIPFLIPYFINQKKRIKRPIITYIISLLIFTTLIFNLKHISNSLDFIEILNNKQTSFLKMSDFQNAGSYFEITKIDDDFFSILKAVPKGIINCFVRPLPWNINSPIELAPLLENCFIVVFLFIAIYHIIFLKTLKNSPSINFLLFCFFSVGLFFLIIGITTPISGALVRYKIPAYPFLFMLILMMLDINFLNKLRFKK